jgi:hypothetical protein
MAKMKKEEREETDSGAIAAVTPGTLSTEAVPELKEEEIPVLTAKVKKLVLRKAASFTGRGVRNVKKGEPFEVNAAVADSLLDTGLFEEI